MTKYAYDAAGNLVEETDALQNTLRYSYTPEGWLESATKADGTVIAYRYDLTGQLLEHSAGGLTIRRATTKSGN